MYVLVHNPSLLTLRRAQALLILRREFLSNSHGHPDALSDSRGEMRPEVVAVCGNRIFPRKVSLGKEGRGKGRQGKNEEATTEVP